MRNAPTSGDGDIPPEKLGEDFFSYGPYAATQPRLQARTIGEFRSEGARQRQVRRRTVARRKPSVEDTGYWLSLMVDTPLPIASNSAHRNRGEISPDGDGNIEQSVNYILSKVWKGEDGKDQLGGVMVQDEIIYIGPRSGERRCTPGGYVVTGGYGGIFGSMTAGAYVTEIPTRKHTWKSEVRVTQLPAKIDGLLRQDGRVHHGVGRHQECSR